MFSWRLRSRDNLASNMENMPMREPTAIQMLLALIDEDPGGEVAVIALATAGAREAELARIHPEPG